MKHGSLVSFFPETRHLGSFPAVFFRGETDPLSWWIALVDLESLEEDTTTLSLLSEEEKRLFATYSYPKRRREWLGGRIAAKAALARLLERPPGTPAATEISILPNPSGAPGIIGLSGTVPALSISHSGRYGAALAAAAPTCGIDIQIVSDKTVRVADRFASRAEEKLLAGAIPGLSRAWRLTLLWSAKEAVKKTLLAEQPAFFKGVDLHSVAGDDPLRLALSSPDGRTVQVHVTLRDEYALAWSILGDAHA
ncbi:MAG: hypothetical protein Kow0089_11220 [Desulfobulbaceae bacterium]